MGAALAAAGNWSYCCGRKEGKSAGNLAASNGLLVEAGFVLAQNWQIISAAILLFSSTPLPQSTCYLFQLFIQIYIYMCPHVCALAHTHKYALYMRAVEKKRS